MLPFISVSARKASPIISGSNGGTRSTATCPVMVCIRVGCVSISQTGKKSSLGISSTGSPPQSVAKASSLSSAGPTPAGCQIWVLSRWITFWINAFLSHRKVSSSLRIASASNAAKRGRISESMSSNLASVVSRFGGVLFASAKMWVNMGQVSFSGVRGRSSSYRLAPIHWSLNSLSTHGPWSCLSSKMTRTGHSKSFLFESFAKTTFTVSTSFAA